MASPVAEKNDADELGKERAQFCFVDLSVVFCEPFCVILCGVVHARSPNTLAAQLHTL